MLSLHEGFPMFPTAHHPHHPHHTGVVGGVMGPGGGVGPVGHSTTPPHHHHHHHAAAAIHSLTARHHSQGPPPPPSSSVAGQLNLHHAGHHQGPHHPHSHLNSAHHQMAANQAYFAGYGHPHHWGNGGGAQGGHQTAPNAAMEHQQQFQVGGLVTSDGGNSWHPSPAAVYTGLSSSLSPRTPVASVGYEEWVNSPSNGQQQQQQQSGGVSSPDASPNNHFVQQQQQQQGNSSNNGASSPSLSDQQQQQLSSYSAAAAAAAAYGKMFSSAGAGDFISPHHAHLHHPHHHNNHGQMVVDPIRMNAGGVITGHHSPDSGLAGSDGLSSAGSPAQQQQQGMLGGGSSGNNLLNLQQQQQQQQNAAGPQGAMTGPSSAGSMGQQNQLVGSNGAGMVNVSRPQPSRSPYEWMKKPSFHSTNVNPDSDVFSAGKTRTKDKYRVVYTDHQRLELEKEFHYSRYITIRRKSELASVLGLSERQVKIWFQNRRAKERKQVKKREEMLHKEKLDVVPSLGAVQQQQQQQQQHHLHSGGQQQHMQHMSVQQQHPSLVSNPQISSSMHMGSVVQMDTKPVLGLD